MSCRGGPSGQGGSGTGAAGERRVSTPWMSCTTQKASVGVGPGVAPEVCPVWVQGWVPSSIMTHEFRLRTLLLTWYACHVFVTCAVAAPQCCLLP